MKIESKLGSSLLIFNKAFNSLIQIYSD